MKNIIYFILAVVACIGLLGSFGWMCYIGYHQDGGGYLMAVGLIVAGYAAYFKIKEWCLKITE